MLTASPVDEAEQHRPAVTRYIRYLIRDPAEAEDLAQKHFCVRISKGERYEILKLLKDGYTKLQRTSALTG